jgi:DNA-binding CsgD family transcriptional regulator
MSLQNIITIDLPLQQTNQFFHISNLLALNLIQSHSDDVKNTLNTLEPNPKDMHIIVHYFESPLTSLQHIDSDLLNTHLHIAICPKLTTELEVTFISSGFHCNMQADDSVVDKINSIKQVQAKEISFSHKAISRYVLQKKRLPSFTNRTKILALTTKKEQQILGFIWDGHSNEEIAHRLGISINTVKMHVQNIYKKTKIKSRGQLFALAG